MYVTFKGNIEIGSHKTGGHLIQVNQYEMHCEGTLKLIEVVTKASLTVMPYTFFFQVEKY